MINKWYKFLLTEERKFAIHNLQKIYEAVEQVQTQNATAEALDQIDPRDFFNFLKDNNLLKIFSDYEIEEKIGQGIMGIAFSLKDPHENYILKLEVHFSSPGGSGQKRPGVDYPQQVYARQQKGEYKKGQVNVLESIALEGAEILTALGEDRVKDNVDFYLAIMSKVSFTTFAGKEKASNKWASLYKNEPRYQGEMSMKEAISEVSFSKAHIFLEMAAADWKPDINSIMQELEYSSFGAGRFKQKEHVLKKISELIKEKVENKDPKGIANILYTVFENKFKYLSKDQFTKMCIDVYDKAVDARLAGKQHSDYHAGNVGFVGDVPHAFDV